MILLYMMQGRKRLYIVMNCFKYMVCLSLCPKEKTVEFDVFLSKGFFFYVILEIIRGHASCKQEIK